MKQKVVKVSDDNRPMKPLEDDGGCTIMEYKCEKWNPRFDRFSDDSSSSIVSRIYLKPDPMAMTKRRPCAIILSVLYYFKFCQICFYIFDNNFDYLLEAHYPNRHSFLSPILLF